MWYGSFMVCQAVMWYGSFMVWQLHVVWQLHGLAVSWHGSTLVAFQPSEGGGALGGVVVVLRACAWRDFGFGSQPTRRSRERLRFRQIIGQAGDLPT